jgi:hypothetical protein
MGPEEEGANISGQAPGAAGQAIAPGPTENVDRIREILFGTQMRGYDQRFAQLEERLMRETGELKSEVRRRLDSLEAYTRQELESLSDRQNTERSERREALDRLSRDLAEATRGLEKRVIHSDEQMAKDLRELRQVMMDRHRTLADELTQCVGKAELLHNRHLEELRADTMDRVALANLLAEVALRIRGEFRVPDIEDANAGANR